MNCVKHTCGGVNPKNLVRFHMAPIWSGMEYRAVSCHKLKKKQLQKLEKIQYRAIHGALRYWSNTPT
jgi:hypothetical protein